MSSSRCYPEKSPKVDRLLDTLSNNVRRELIYYFEQGCRKQAAGLDELVDYIDERTPGSDPDGLRIELVHSHIPRLEKRGWVETDETTGTVRYHGHEAARGLLTDTAAVFKTRPEQKF